MNKLVKTTLLSLAIISQPLQAQVQSATERYQEILELNDYYGEKYGTICPPREDWDHKLLKVSLGCMLRLLPDNSEEGTKFTRDYIKLNSIGSARMAAESEIERKQRQQVIDAEIARLSKLPSPSINMSINQETSWGNPRRITITTSSQGNVEFWYYSRGLLVYTNGRLSSITESSY
jgi:hypothetical protein